MAYRAFGTENSGIGAVTYALPSSWVAGDLLLLIVETGSELPAAPAGWTQLVTAENAGQTRLTVFWRIAQAGDTAPTVADPGDHQLGHTASISGVDATRPWDLDGGGSPSIATAIVTTDSSAISLPSVTTTTANCQVLLLVSVPADSASWPFTASGSAWVNAALTGFGSGAGYFGHAAVDGNGGAFGGVLGVKATAGVVGATTSTLSGGAQQQALITVALRPPDTSVSGTLGVTLADATAAGTGSVPADGQGAATTDASLAGGGAVDGLPVDGIGAAATTASLDGAGSAAVAGDGAGSVSASLAGAGFVPGGLAVHSVTSSIALYGVTGGTTHSSPGGKPLTGGGTIDPDGRTVGSWNPPASGATFYAVLARAKAATKTISDNRGNTYSQITVQNYQPDSAWETAVYEVRPAIGGDGTIVSIPIPATEEATLMVTALESANVLHQHVTGYSTSATSIVSPTIQTSGPGLILWTWFGDGPTLGGPGDEGVPLVVNATTPGAAVVDSRIVNHNNGWIQCKQWMQEVPAAGTYSLAVTQGRSEGARWYGAAYQVSEYVSGDLSAALASSSLAGAGAAEITAAATLGSDATMDGAGAAAVTTAIGEISVDATLAGSGSTAVDGAGSATAEAAGLAAAGNVTGGLIGDAAVLLAASSLDATGAAEVFGTGAASSNLAASAAGAPAVAGDAVAVAADAAASAAGYAVDAGAIVGELVAVTDAVLVAAGAAVTSSRPPRANYSTTATGVDPMPSTLIAGNREPDLLVPLLEPHATIPGTRQPIDLTGLVSVRLRWSVPGATADVFLTAEVYGLPTLGLVAHTWLPGETDTPGLHRYRVELTWANGEVQTVPSDPATYTLLISPAEISAAAG